MPNNPAPPTHLLPLKVAADRLGIHPNTLRKRADNGQIESTRDFYGNRLFPVAAVEAARTARKES